MKRIILILIILALTILFVSCESRYNNLEPEIILTISEHTHNHYVVDSTMCITYENSAYTSLKYTLNLNNRPTQSYTFHSSHLDMNEVVRYLVDRYHLKYAPIKPFNYK